MKQQCLATVQAQGVARNGANKDAHVFTKRLEKAIQRLSNRLSSTKAGALIQVWMPELCSRGRVLLSTEGLPFSISGVGDLLALFRCISCKYRFDADPAYGASMGAIGRVYYYGQPQLCLDVQQYDKNTYMRITEAQLCRIHSTLILPIFEEESESASAVVELSHHDKTAEFANIVQVFSEALAEVKLRTSDVRLGNWKLGLRKWPVEVCSVPLNSIEDTNLPKKHPDEQGISNEHVLGRAMQTGLHLPHDGWRGFCVVGFGHVSEFLMNIGMDSLTNSEETIHKNIDASCTVFPPQSSPLRNCSTSMEGSQGFISRNNSESGSANTTQFPDLHSNDSVKPEDTVRVCQASQPMAQEADQDMQRDPPKDDIRIIMDEEDGSTEAKKKENRLGGGAGKRLTYRDLEAHFGHGLKDAARRLGICPTTLKRACRRNGITRWPSRQISKLLKVWKQMGYKGEPPSWLLQNAISGNLRSENLAYILGSGLHVGLNPQGCECTPKTGALKTKQGQISIYCSNDLGSDPDGPVLVDEDVSVKNLTHHGAFTAALHGTDEDGFGYQDDQGRGHTWHAGHLASVVLHPAFPCHSQTTSAFPVETMHYSRGCQSAKQGEGPVTFDLERTQRGGTGVVPVLSELPPPVDVVEDVLMQQYHVPMGFEASQSLFQ